MAKERILVVDDEEDILELINYNLARDGFDVVSVATGEEGLKKAREVKPDLILLDIMLPGINGLDVCKRLKSDLETLNVPIIMLSARGEEADIVTGLELGADDYIGKPFSPRILLARVRAVIRRAQRENGSEGETVKVHELSINPEKYEVVLRENPLELTSTEFKILHFLARHPGSVFTRSQIVKAVHGDDYPVTDRSVDVQMVNLRKKLGESGEYIETIRGVGYRLRE